jgi:hypothetical protein
MQIKTQMKRLISGLILFHALHPLCGQDAGSGLQKREAAAALHPDIERDPAPDFIHGYSGHAGIGWSHWRVEAEILRTDVPAWLESNKGFDVSYRGGGAKVQYFLSPQQRGTFPGVRTEITRESVRLQLTDQKIEPTRHDQGWPLRFLRSCSCWIPLLAGPQNQTGRRGRHFDSFRGVS